MVVFEWVKRAARAVVRPKPAPAAMIEHHVHINISDAQIRKAVRDELKPMVAQAVAALAKGASSRSRSATKLNGVR